ncbi:MAG: hypothetical protein QW728_07150, partial [Thermoplasmata archaeon]
LKYGVMDSIIISASKFEPATRIVLVELLKTLAVTSQTQEGLQYAARTLKDIAENDKDAGVREAASKKLQEINLRKELRT